MNTNTNSEANKTAMGILLTLSLTHFSNDLFQSIVPALYPIFEEELMLSLSQVGIIALVYQIFSSIFQPLVGMYFDKRPRPYYLMLGIACVLVGLTCLAYAKGLIPILIAVSFMGLGSSIIHPEASRLTHLASGGKHGLAQAIFQVGGNLGGSLGPLLAALIITPYGQHYIIIFSFLAFAAILFTSSIYRWYKDRLDTVKKEKKPLKHFAPNPLPKNKTLFALVILLILVFSKYVYLSSLTNYYTFYLIDKFGISTQESQLYLFIFLFAIALGTFIGGPIGDRIGRKFVIWFSILGTAPFSLMIPHLGLVGTAIFSVFIGIILASAFSAIIVYAQELLPAKLGLISGLFFGLAFGIAGIAAAILGWVADIHGIQFVYSICAYMPLLGLVAAFLPNIKYQNVSKNK